MSREVLYQHIIWVDDFDNKDISLSSIPLENEWDSEEDIIGETHENDINMIFGEKYAGQVKPIKDILEMLNNIDNHLNEYDCIILDVNLEKSLDEEQKKLVKDLCEKKGVRTGDDIGKCGGYYIYLYLLKSGFPTSNICMFTGNKGENNSTGRWEKKFLDAGICPPESIIRTDNIKLCEWINELFCKEYYKTRLLVYKACEYWKRKLETTESVEIEFNKIYYQGNSDYLIEKANFVEMLDCIERLFPIMEPTNSESIYYQVLQVLTMYHEESAKIDFLNKEKFSHIRRYHQAIRNFRNWSAHNQFIDNKIDANLFVYIFCITLRTYFLCTENQCDIICDEYEREYVEDIINNVFDFTKFQKIYNEAFNRHFDKVKNFGRKKNNCWDCKDMTSLLFSSGWCRNLDDDKMSFSDILLNVIDDLIIQDKLTIEMCENQPGFELTCNYRWAENYKNINLEKTKKSDPFKAIAYILYVQESVGECKEDVTN